MKEEQPSHNLDSEIHCHICAHREVEMIPGYELFSLVTSDCKLWPKTGKLGMCTACGCVQKAINYMGQENIKKIYDNYNIYYQSEGFEQNVFDELSGNPLPRSAQLLERLFSHFEFPERGRLLDIGCGNGALLREFNRISPLWSLVETELNKKYKKVAESIDRVEPLYVCQPQQIPGTFDIITMIHVLEHIPSPKKFLMQLQNKLEPGGLLILEVLCPSFVRLPCIKASFNLKATFAMRQHFPYIDKRQKTNPRN